MNKKRAIFLLKILGVIASSLIIIGATVFSCIYISQTLVPSVESNISISKISDFSYKRIQKNNDPRFANYKIDDFVRIESSTKVNTPITTQKFTVDKDEFYGFLIKNQYFISETGGSFEQGDMSEFTGNCIGIIKKKSKEDFIQSLKEYSVKVTWTNYFGKIMSIKNIPVENIEFK